MDKTIAEPGDPVKLKIRAAPDSFVGILAVDQSVILLKSGNDISYDKVSQWLNLVLIFTDMDYG